MHSEIRNVSLRIHIWAGFNLPVLLCRSLVSDILQAANRWQYASSQHAKLKVAHVSQWRELRLVSSV